MFIMHHFCAVVSYAYLFKNARLNASCRLQNFKFSWSFNILHCCVLLSRGYFWCELFHQLSRQKNDNGAVIKCIWVSRYQVSMYIHTYLCSVFSILESTHTTYSWNIKWQKCAGISGLWVLNEIFQKIYPENMKKIVGAVWKLPAK